MKSWMFLFLLVTSTSLASESHKDMKAAPVQPGQAQFGAPLTIENSKTLSELVANYETHKSTDVLTEGTVQKVCKKKGCWMVVQDGESEVRVTFKKYAFFVPKNIDGKKVRIQGRIVQKTISVEEARHYAEDEGLSKEEIAKITEPKNIYRFIATGVELKSKS